MSIFLGLVSAKIKPRYEAPNETAKVASSLLVIPQILTFGAMCLFSRLPFQFCLDLLVLLTFRRYCETSSGKTQSENWCMPAIDNRFARVRKCHLPIWQLPH